MKKLAPFLVVLLTLMLVPSFAFAASPWTEQDSAVDQAFHKLDFGVKNLLGGWTELVTVPVDYHKNKDSVAKGVGVGLWNALIYTGGGALHTATFFIPQIDIPLPNNGVQFE
ncbi:hypothetical protein N9K06_00295 [Omnitrophica bacterium]|nr:hypothetical protein [Candidatus Omnitrophota bacterium]